MYKIKKFIIYFLNTIGIQKNNFFIFFNKKIGGLKPVVSGFGFILCLISDNFVSYVLRPKKISDSKQRSTYLPANYVSDFGILIQGPLGKEKDQLFLLETIKSYFKLFPKTKIVLSTWADENSYLFENLNEDLYILKNNPPQSTGRRNFNLQLKSTSEGLKIFYKLNIKNVLKTRPDCRISRPNIVPFLLSLQESFPTKQKNFKRIFLSSQTTFKYRVYGAADILLYGPTKELSLYFNYEDMEEIVKKYGYNNNLIHNETLLTSEVLLCARYLKNIGINLDWTLNQWWYCLKEYFGIIDVDSIDFFWKKYNWQYEKRFLRAYDNEAGRCVEFVDWLALFNNHKVNWQKTKYKEKYEIINGKIKNITVL